MLTHIVIEHTLMAEALQLTGLKTKKAVVEEALRELIARRKRDQLQSACAESQDVERRRMLAAALEEIVSLNPFADIDGSAWQREQRQDRPLPNRE